MKRFFISLFSIYLWIATFTCLAVVFVLTFTFKKLFGYRFAYRWVVAPGFKFCMALSLNSVRVQYHPAFDSSRSVMFCQNHVTLMDAFIAGCAIPQPFCGIMHNWHFNIPIYGWLMSVTEGIAVFPKVEGNLSRMTVAARKRHRAGISILSFPEGTRTLDGAVGSFRSGVFKMARDAGYPVVPLAVRGAYQTNRKGRWTVRPFQPIEIYVGKPIETIHRKDEELEMIASEMQTIIASWVEENAPRVEQKCCAIS